MHCPDMIPTTSYGRTNECNRYNKQVSVRTDIAMPNSLSISSSVGYVSLHSSHPTTPLNTHCCHMLFCPLRVRPTHLCSFIPILHLLSFYLTALFACIVLATIDRSIERLSM